MSISVRIRPESVRDFVLAVGEELSNRLAKEIRDPEVQIDPSLYETSTGASLTLTISRMAEEMVFKFDVDNNTIRFNNSVAKPGGDLEGRMDLILNNNLIESVVGKVLGDHARKLVQLD